MSKEDFLYDLRDSLTGTVPFEVVRENVRYYDDYLSGELSKGRTMDEIIQEIGDAKLVARSIIDATPGSGEGNYDAPEYSQSRDTYSGTDDFGQSSDQDSQGTFGGNIHYYDLNKWYYKLAAIVIVVAIVTLVLTIVGGVLSLVIPLLPVFGLVIVIMWFVGGSWRR